MDKWTEGELVRQPETANKRSRWRITLHLWAGACLAVYVQISGLLEHVLSELGVQGGASDAAASSYATAAAVVVVGVAAIGYYLSKLLVEAIDQSNMPDKGKLATKALLPIAYFAGAVVLSAATAPLI